LLRCLLGELKLPARIVASIPPKTARLLIGDQAIRFRQEHGADREINLSQHSPTLAPIRSLTNAERLTEFWDLGEQWKKLVQLPFVYALWLIRPEVANSKSIAGQLRALRNDNLRDIENIIASQQEFPAEFCRRYYAEHLRFSFGSEEQRGLRAFAELCQKHGLLPKADLVLDLV
jgi:predicted solute-binding protein